jgi:prepilin-type N-terminal cleavage/methylation domain-containing protein
VIAAVRPRPPRTRLTSRHAFTLVELLVSMTLLALVLAALFGALRGQQRAHHDLADAADARRQVRHAAAVLQPELRALATDALAPEGSDLLAIADSAIELRSAIGSSVVCAHDGGTTIDLPPLTLASGATLTAWTAAPGPRDVALVYDDGPAPGMADDRWRAFEVASLREDVAYCAGTPLTRSADAGTVRFRATLVAGSAVPLTVRRGAPVRFVRRTRWSLYRSADRRWYLGQREWNGSWSTTQPVGGPYRAFRRAPRPPGSCSRGSTRTGAPALRPATWRAVADVRAAARGCRAPRRAGRERECGPPWSRRPRSGGVREPRRSFRSGTARAGRAAPWRRPVAALRRSP